MRTPPETFASWFVGAGRDAGIVFGSHMRPMLPIPVLEMFAHHTLTWQAIDKAVSNGRGALLVPASAYSKLRAEITKVKIAIPAHEYSPVSIARLDSRATQDALLVVSDDFLQILLDQVEINLPWTEGDEKWDGTRHRTAERISAFVPDSPVCCISQEARTVTLFLSSAGAVSPEGPVTQQIPRRDRHRDIVSEVGSHWVRCVRNLDELLPAGSREIAALRYDDSYHQRLTVAALLARRCGDSLERLCVIGGDGFSDRKPPGKSSVKLLHAELVEQSVPLSLLT